MWLRENVFIRILLKVSYTSLFVHFAELLAFCFRSLLIAVRLEVFAILAFLVRGVWLGLLCILVTFGVMNLLVFTFWLPP